MSEICGISRNLSSSEPGRARKRRRDSALAPCSARRDSAGATSAGAGTAGSETKRKNSKTSDMSESVSSSLSEVLFFLSERLRQSATRTKRGHCPAARCMVRGERPAARCIEPRNREKRAAAHPCSSSIIVSNMSTCDYPIRPPMATNSGANTTDTIVMSLIRMLMDGPEVSLNGSPTVSPTTVALCVSDPLPP